MYAVVKELTQNVFEDFGRFKDKETADYMAKFIKAFLNYDVEVVWVEGIDI